MKKISRCKIKSRILFSSSKSTRYFFLLIALILISILFRIYFNNKNSHKKPETFESQSTNLTTFLNRSKFRGNSHICEENTEVLVGIISAPIKFEARKSIRASLSKNLSSKWKLLFFLGEMTPVTVERTEMLEKELREEQDLIIANVKDTYNNLTLKVGMLYYWVNNNCKNAKYLLKVDDDMYINTEKMNQFIKCITTSDNKDKNRICDFQEKETKLHQFFDSEHKTMVNYIISGHVYHDLIPIRDPNSKWYLSEKIYPSNSLPYFVSGTAYLITSNIIPYTLEAAKNIPLIKLEDVYFTGLIMSHQLNLSLTHITNWSNFRPRWDDICYYRQLLTAHGLHPEEIMYFSQNVNNSSSQTCDTWLRKLLIMVNQFFSFYVPRVT